MDANVQSILAMYQMYQRPLTKQAVTRGFSEGYGAMVTLTNHLSSFGLTMGSSAAPPVDTFQISDAQTLRHALQLAVC